MTLPNLRLKRGFTIIELLVVIVVIGILATVVIVAYNGIQKSARDNAVLSDLDGVNSELTRYTASHNGELGTAVVWYSGAGQNPNIEFTPSSDNIVDIVADETSYCIRVYNPGANANNIYAASSKGSSTVACDSLTPSISAILDSPASPNWVSIANGGSSSCAINASSLAYCWGYGSNGQVGNGGVSSANNPVPVSTAGVLAGKKVLKLSSGYAFACAIASDSLPYCWGLNSAGQLGNNSTTQANVPVAVDTSGMLAGKTVKAISTGSTHSCVIASDDLAYCWGYNSAGQLGNNSTTQANVPVAVDTSGVLAGKTIKEISAGNGHTCVIASDNLAYCWGNGSSGALGRGSTTTSNIPVAVSTSGVLSGKSLKTIASGYQRACVITSESLAYCWGHNSVGQLGNNSTSQATSPVAVNTSGVLAGKKLKMIITGDFDSNTVTCALDQEGIGYCWGNDVYAAAGNGAGGTSSVPTNIDMSGVLAGKKLRSISTEAYHTCAVSTDNIGYCWGMGTNKRLGNGLLATEISPILVIVP